MANVVGQWIGWRWGFVIVAILASLTALSVWLYAPARRGRRQGQSPARAVGPGQGPGVADPGDRGHRLRRHVLRLYLPSRHPAGGDPLLAHRPAGGAGGVRGLA
ncbi:hypothetical protein ACRAWD_23470 [Caulobacter segnis]